MRVIVVIQGSGLAIEIIGNMTQLLSHRIVELNGDHHASPAGLLEDEVEDAD